MGKPRDRDGGYGWVIVLAFFLNELLIDGTRFSFGVYFVEFLDEFNRGKGETAWVGSLMIAIYNMGGPIFAYIVNKVGYRKASMIGSIITTCSYILSYFATEVYHLYFTYGVLQGLGFGLMFLSGNVVIGRYFYEKRAKAMGMALCGAGVGTFIFIPLVRYCIDTYTWRGSMFIMASVSLNGCVLSALYRPVEDADIDDEFEVDAENDKGSKYDVQSIHSINEFTEPLVVNGKVTNGVTRSVHSIHEFTDPLVANGKVANGVTKYDVIQDMTAVSTPIPTSNGVASRHNCNGTVLQTLKQNGLHNCCTEGVPMQLKDSSGAESEHAANHIATSPVSIETHTSETTSSSGQNTTTSHSNGHISSPNSITEPKHDTPPQPGDTAEPLSLSQLSKEKHCQNGSVPKGAPIPSSPCRDTKEFHCQNGDISVPNSPLRPTKLKYVHNGHLPPASIPLILHKSSNGLNGHVSSSPSPQPRLLADIHKGHLASHHGSHRSIRSVTNMAVLSSSIFGSNASFEVHRRAGSKRSNMGGKSASQCLRLSQSESVDETMNGRDSNDNAKFSNHFIESMFPKVLMKNVNFILMMSVCIFAGTPSFIPFSMLPDFCLKIGASATEGAWTLSAIGIGGTISRIAGGWLADMPCVHSLTLLGVCFFCCGLLTIINAFMTSYIGVVIYATLYGAFFGAVYVVQPIVILEYLGDEYIAEIMGCLMFMYGVSNFIGSPMAGWIFDWTGSYTISFLVAGCFFIVASVVNFLTLCTKTKTPPSDRLEHIDTVD